MAKKYDPTEKECEIKEDEDSTNQDGTGFLNGVKNFIIWGVVLLVTITGILNFSSWDYERKFVTKTVVSVQNESFRWSAKKSSNLISFMDTFIETDRHTIKRENTLSCIHIVVGEGAEGITIRKQLAPVPNIFGVQQCTPETAQLEIAVSGDKRVNCFLHYISPLVWNSFSKEGNPLGFTENELVSLSTLVNQYGKSFVDFQQKMGEENFETILRAADPNRNWGFILVSLIFIGLLLGFVAVATINKALRKHRRKKSEEIRVKCYGEVSKLRKKTPRP